jgi:hypothetical protein
MTTPGTARLDLADLTPDRMRSRVSILSAVPSGARVGELI